MWNLDWWKARRFAYAGTPVRRAAWADKWIVFKRGLVWVTSTGSSRVAEADDFGPDDFRAGDWTTQPPGLQCDALTPAQEQIPPAPPWAGNETFGDGVIAPPPAPFYIQ